MAELAPVFDAATDRLAGGPFAINGGLLSLDIPGKGLEPGPCISGCGFRSRRRWSCWLPPSSSLAAELSRLDTLLFAWLAYGGRGAVISPSS